MTAQYYSSRSQRTQTTEINEFAETNFEQLCECYRSSYQMTKLEPGANTVLLVDDDEDHLALHKHMLEQGNFQVLTANNAVQALELLKEQKVDCAIVDILMPHIGGRELVSMMRQSLSFTYLPVILLTAGNANLERNALESGADLFCIKRNAKKELLRQVRLLLC